MVERTFSFRLLVISLNNKRSCLHRIIIWNFSTFFPKQNFLNQLCPRSMLLRMRKEKHQRFLVYVDTQHQFQSVNPLYTNWCRQNHTAHANGDCGLNCQMHEFGYWKWNEPSNWYGFVPTRISWKCERERERSNGVENWLWLWFIYSKQKPSASRNKHMNIQWNMEIRTFFVYWPQTKIYIRKPFNKVQFTCNTHISPYSGVG